MSLPKLWNLKHLEMMRMSSVFVWSNWLLLDRYGSSARYLSKSFVGVSVTVMREETLEAAVYIVWVKYFV